MWDGADCIHSMWTTSRHASARPGARGCLPGGRRRVVVRREWVALRTTFREPLRPVGLVVLRALPRPTVIRYRHGCECGWFREPHTIGWFGKRAESNHRESSFRAALSSFGSPPSVCLNDWERFWPVGWRPGGRGVLRSEGTISLP